MPQPGKARSWRCMTVFGEGEPAASLRSKAQQFLGAGYDARGGLFR